MYGTVQNQVVTALDFTALTKSKSEADAIKKQTRALAKDYDHLLQNQKKLQVIFSKPCMHSRYGLNQNEEKKTTHLFTELLG